MAWYRISNILETGLSTLKKKNNETSQHLKTNPFFSLVDKQTPDRRQGQDTHTVIFLYFFIKKTEKQNREFNAGSDTWRPYKQVKHQVKSYFHYHYK